ncbi:MAG: PTS sugar transporter subunit IIB [Erysipelotrichaceae bacterium]|nr:PTS sugar transporter subunit IIB [Erysipelotrichaceae bacterium]
MGMNVVFARVDNRLMHGIVITQYFPTTGAKRIMVVDDDTANNPARKDMMNLAKPNGVASSIITFEKAKENILANKYGDQTIFLLAKSPRTIAEIVKLGVPIKKLIIGCTDMLNEGHKLSDRAFINDDEVEACKELRDAGTQIVVQHNPAIPQVDVWSVLK